MTKVLVVSNGYPSEKYPLLGIFERDQASALKKQGFDVAVCALDMRSIRRKRKFGISRFIDDGMNIIECNTPAGRIGLRLLNGLSWLTFKKAYKKLVKEWGKPDIIHAHFGRATGYVALKAKQKYGIDYIITEHDSGIKDGIFTKAEEKLLRKIYDGAKGRIAVSRSFQEKLQEVFALPFEYIPNIVDINSFLNVSKIPHEGINVVSVGTLVDMRKGMDVTIRAFAKAKSVNQSLGKLTIIGGGSSMDILKNIADSEGTTDSVVFTGQLSRKEIAEQFAMSDIFVLASRNETFGVVYIEAMCAGLPVIATKCGGPEGIFTEDEGKYVQVDNVEELSDAILEIARNLSAYNPEEIKQFCINNYSPDAVGAQLAKLIGSN